MKILRAIARLWLASSALACSSAATGSDVPDNGSEIVGGARDTRHPSVAIVQWAAIQEGRPVAFPMCSATLVASEFVLTAAHCVVPADKRTTNANYVAYFGTTPKRAAPKDRYAVKRAFAHPKYSPHVFGAYDVAVLELERPVSGVPPVPIASAIPNLVGRTVTHVGWGTSVSSDAEHKSGAGTKRWVALPVLAQHTQTLETGNGRSGICNGDSGGPALLDVHGTEVVVGVHSYIDDNDTCAQSGFSFRPDTADAFLSKYLPPSAFRDVAADFARDGDPN